MVLQQAGLSIRPLESEDLPAALLIQSEVYPAFLREDREAFASRLAVAASYCLAATRDDVLVAYLLAHGWPSRTPPAIGTILATDAASESLFIHDLAVSPAGRGSGIGRYLIAHAFGLASGDGLERAELIAVEGAADYWRTLDFADVAVSADLAAKVAGYGSEARWMERNIAPFPACGRL